MALAIFWFLALGSVLTSRAPLPLPKPGDPRGLCRAEAEAKPCSTRRSFSCLTCLKPSAAELAGGGRGARWSGRRQSPAPCPLGSREHGDDVRSAAWAAPSTATRPNRWYRREPPIDHGSADSHVAFWHEAHGALGPACRLRSDPLRCGIDWSVRAGFTGRCKQLGECRNALPSPTRLTPSNLPLLVKPSSCCISIREPLQRLALPHVVHPPKARTKDVGFLVIVLSPAHYRPADVHPEKLAI